MKSPTDIDPRDDARPWWRFPIMWLVVGGPAAVVVAALAKAVIAHRIDDPVLQRDPAEFSGASRVAAQPAMEGRNRAAHDAVEGARTGGAPAGGG